MYALTIKQTKYIMQLYILQNKLHFSHIYTNAYIGEYTCTHKKFLYSLILYLYANVSSTMRSAPSFSHATLKTSLSPFDIRKLLLFIATFAAP